MQDRPTAAELLQAVREFLAEDAPSEFHRRVAANVLAIVERELALGVEFDASELKRLASLLGHGGGLRDLNEELARGIRNGSLDARHGEVMAHLRATARDKLRIANPKYL